MDRTFLLGIPLLPQLKMKNEPKIGEVVDLLTFNENSDFAVH